MKKTILLLLVVTLSIVLSSCKEKAKSYCIEYRNHGDHYVWVSSLSWGKYDYGCGNLGKTLKGPGDICILHSPIPKQTTIKWDRGDKKFTKTLTIPTVPKNFDGVILITFIKDDDVTIKVMNKQEHEKFRTEERRK